MLYTKRSPWTLNFHGFFSHLGLICLHFGSRFQHSGFPDLMSSMLVLAGIFAAQKIRNIIFLYKERNSDFHFFRELWGIMRNLLPSWDGINLCNSFQKLPLFSFIVVDPLTCDFLPLFSDIRSEIYRSGIHSLSRTGIPPKGSTPRKRNCVVLVPGTRFLEGSMREIPHPQAKKIRISLIFPNWQKYNGKACIS